MWIIAIIGVGAVVLFGVFILIFNIVSPSNGLLMSISEDMTDEEIDAVPTSKEEKLWHGK